MATTVTDLGIIPYGSNRLITITDTVNGVLTDAGTMTVKHTDPLGNQTTPTLTHVSTGTYTFPAITGTSGTCTFRAFSTGAGTDSRDYKYEVDVSANP